MKTKTNNHALPGLFIGLGIMCAGYFMATSFKAVKLANQKITVKGYAQKNVTSDFAKWRGHIENNGQTREEAYNSIEVAKLKVVAFLKSKGIDEEKVEFSTVNMYDSKKLNEKGRQTNEIEHYTASTTVSFQSNDINLIKQIAKTSEGLIKEGLNFTSESPQYLLQKLDGIKVALLGEAAKDAKIRAEKITSSVDNSIGPVKSAQQGVFQITAQNDPSVSSYGMYNTSSVEKTVKAVVTVSFAVAD